MTQQDTYHDADIEREEDQSLLSHNDVQTTLGHKSQGSSWYASVFLVVNAGLGAGLLNIPAAFDQSGGMLVAILVQAVLMVFIIGSLLILVYCSTVHHSATYQDVVYSMCGKGVQMTCAVVIVLYCFGTCITFFIIIGDQWDIFLKFAYGPDYCLFWYMSRRFTMVSTCVVFVLPLCFPKRIDFLKYASAMGVLAVGYCVALVSVKYFVTSDTTHVHIKTGPTHWTDVFIVVPVICFSYQCHLSIVPIYACLRKRTFSEFLRVVMVAMVIMVLTYTVTASFGYLTFGSGVNQDILLSYNPTADVLIAVVFIGFKMYTTYPILLFVGRAALDSVWVQMRRLDPEKVESQERHRRLLVTTVWFVATLFLAVVVPNIGVVISLLGGFAALFIFTFPGLCLLQMLLQGYIDRCTHPHRYYALFAMAVGYLVIGAFIFGLVTTQSLFNDFGVTNVPTHHVLTPVCN